MRGKAGNDCRGAACLDGACNAFLRGCFTGARFQQARGLAARGEPHGPFAQRIVGQAELAQQAQVPLQQIPGDHGRDSSIAPEIQDSF